MTGEAKADMAIYDVQPQEENKLRVIEDQLLKLLLDKGITVRPIWTSRSEADTRFVQVCITSSPNPKVLFELPGGELARLSPEELISLLRDNIEL